MTTLPVQVGRIWAIVTCIYDQTYGPYSPTQYNSYDTVPGFEYHVHLPYQYRAYYKKALKVAVDNKLISVAFHEVHEVHFHTPTLSGQWLVKIGRRMKPAKRTKFLRNHLTNAR